MSHKAAEQSRNERRQRAEQAARASGRRRLRIMIGTASALALVAAVTAMVLTSRPESSDAIRTAPEFTLTDTGGSKHTLAQHRGENVLLYFSEGAGCQSCIVQMGEIEKQAAAFEKLDVTVLPIVMNTREQITADMTANGVTTPFLLDDGTVSEAYGTLGKGMHAGLPGHSFVLIDRQGRQRWYGEYPSMWLAPQDLLDEIRSNLSA
ncbi:peroxiredoxin family protein [uncultured Nocardioides sp.]|uniref:peroxiredoxin family protein n=1 Tax=uncultured Nocardioides sp. TaxID=198441 RepID=UPI000C66F561|nr:peroxiredoxin family protein [uncultured Nocardioides sp.]MAY97723.1 redoxin [Nocardioides sp.]|tara:strand:- start:1538 stop:2158 length:621 start_codon:yes stop_codon:yes gene_type:complete